MIDSGPRKRPDVVVIGGGPAGLAAAIACLQKGVDTLLVERGRHLSSRDRQHSEQTITGIGGAGLFSDGKFSFYPAASKLWELKPAVDLEKAYDWCRTILRSHGVNAPDLPANLEKPVPTPVGEGFVRKAYPSFYMTRSQREALIRRLADESKSVLQTETSVCAVSVSPLSLLAVKNGKTLSSSRASGSAEILPKAVIFATGRLGPLLLQKQLSSANLVFRRLEVGVRIEQEASAFFLNSEGGIDPKLICRGVFEREWRTFCCCRHGELVVSRADGVLSVSGRADGSPTQMSNVGFLVRITNSLDPAAQWPSLLRRLMDISEPIAESLDGFMNVRSGSPVGHRAVLGDELADVLVEGLALLRDQIGRDRFVGAHVHGPAIEGVASYPFVTASNLQLGKHPVWVVGDACGLFRGLTAALVSGYFSGCQAARCIRS